MSKDGKQIAFAYARKGGGPSSIWMMNSDGSNLRPLQTGGDDSNPVFSAADQKVYFVRAKAFEHYSPIVGARRHKLDVFSIELGTSQVTQISQQQLYEITSISLDEPAKHLLWTTYRSSGFLIESYNLADAGTPEHIYTPHVKDAPSVGPVLGVSAYSRDGLTIYFLAASEHCGGNFDYNLYSMSANTGAQVGQLTHNCGMADDLVISNDGKFAVVSAGHDIFLVDFRSETVQKMSI